MPLFYEGLPSKNNLRDDLDKFVAELTFYGGRYKTTPGEDEQFIMAYKEYAEQGIEEVSIDDWFAETSTVVIRRKHRRGSSLEFTSVVHKDCNLAYLIRMSGWFGPIDDTAIDGKETRVSQRIYEVLEDGRINILDQVSKTEFVGVSDVMGLQDERAAYVHSAMEMLKDQLRVGLLTPLLSFDTPNDTRELDDQ